MDMVAREDQERAGIECAVAPVSLSDERRGEVAQKPGGRREGV